MRIVIVGPTHPYKGGIAQHTTQLAHTLQGLGNYVHVESWRNQYPARLYKGQLKVPVDQPEIPLFHPVTQQLSWNRPDSWISTAKRASEADAVIFVVANPVQIVPYLTMIPILRRAEVSIVGLMHNVLPHESRPWDRALTTLFLRQVDLVVTHSAQQAEDAKSLGADSPVVLDLPPNLDPASIPPRVVRTNTEDPLRLLFFGLVRPYKGLDTVLDAMPSVPQAHLTIAGEFWTPIEETTEQVSALGLNDRVEIHSKYIPASELSDLFAGVDLVVLPYRSVTGSGNTKMALLFNRPLIVSDTGVLPSEVSGGVGLTFSTGSSSDLARRLKQAADPSTYNQMAELVDRSAHSTGEAWRSYARGLMERLQ